ncbi:hypothetical protein C8J56DRAFT_907665 [Mycena floridula]|nr:hypothetical protein C8J56DRAFT_907665 [Mycena floridula]
MAATLNYSTAIGSATGLQTRLYVSPVTIQLLGIAGCMLIARASSYDLPRNNSWNWRPPPTFLDLVAALRLTTDTSWTTVVTMPSKIAASKQMQLEQRQRDREAEFMIRDASALDNTLSFNDKARHLDLKSQAARMVNSQS